MTTANGQVRCGVLVRISDDPAIDDDQDGDSGRYREAAGVRRQETDCKALAAAVDWPVTRVYVENDVSAFRRKKIRLPDGSYGLRTVRPDFRECLADLSSGVINRLVAYDLDRVARDPRDLEDLIDVVEANKVPTRAVTGSLDLSTDSGITMARIMCAVANKSSRDTARRVSRARLDAAELGKPSGGGLRSYGYTADMQVVPGEAAVLQEIAAHIVDDGWSLRRIMIDLNERGIRPVKAAQWGTRSIDSAIRKPRIAGLTEHCGEIIGTGDWEPIITRELWEKVILALKARSFTRDGFLRYWLTGILLCSVCGQMLKNNSGGRKRRYTCHPEKPLNGCGTIAINGQDVEDFVETAVLEYLSRDDVLAQLAERMSPDRVAQARADVADDEAQLAELAELWGKRAITIKEWLSARQEIEQRLDLSQSIIRRSAPGIVRRLVGGDIRATWADMPAMERRETVRLLLPSGIIVGPATRHRTFGNTFNSDRLSVPDWQPTAEH